MKKNNENKFNEYVLRIGGTLICTITLTPYDWRIGVVVKENAAHERNYAFSSRNFRYTEKYMPTERAACWGWRTRRELIACMENWGYERKDYVIQSYEDDDVEAYSVIDEDGCVTFSIEIN